MISPSRDMVPDPFGVRAVRDAVLTAWAAFPTRFVEDLHTERDHAHDSYRDRLLVELAQNASDAAALDSDDSEPRRPGELLLELETRDASRALLTATNTGAPLDTDGVAALASLRASRKPESGGAVGRFGVGFNAVLVVTDEPEIHSRTGSVGFSRSRTHADVEATPALAEELRRQGGQVPVLRIPYPIPPRPVPDGYSTMVLLPLLEEAVAPVRTAVRELAEHPEPLLIGLESLGSLRIRVDGQTWVATRDRYLTHRESGVVWAMPRSGEWPGGSPPGVLHAPTPTDEPVTLPALLVASAPTEPGRRRVQRGDDAAAVALGAGVAYAGLLEELAGTGLGPADLASMLPFGLGQGWFDNAVRQSAVDNLSTRRILPLVGEPTLLTTPDRAVTVRAAGDLRTDQWRLLAAFRADLVRESAVTRALRIPAVGLDEILESMTGSDPQAWAGQVGPLLELTSDPARREDLALIPVPLADGGVSRGVRGVLLLERDLPAEIAEAIAELNVTVPLAHRAVCLVAVDNPAIRAGLERLGATSASMSSLLDHPAVRAEIDEITSRTADLDDVSDEDMRRSRAILTLVVATWNEAAWQPGERAWLHDLLLPDEQGFAAPAATLVQPGSLMSRLVDDSEVCSLAGETAALLPAEGWRVLGVADIPIVDVLHDVDLDAEDESLVDLPDAAEWSTQTTAHLRRTVGYPPQPIDELRIVRDLDLVAPRQLPALLAWLDVDAEAADVRHAVTTPTRLVGSGGAASVRSHAGWWLGRELGATSTVLPSSPWAGMLPVTPPSLTGLSPDLLAALGVVTDVDQLPADVLAQSLAHAAASVVTPGRLLALWNAMAAARGVDAATPETEMLWGLGREGRPVRVPAGDLVVIDGPQWLQRQDLTAFVVAPQGRADHLAAVLDVDSVHDVADGRIDPSGVPVTMPESLRDLFPAATQWLEHEELLVDGESVGWWVDDAGLVHAETLVGLALGAAWAAGCWSLRHAAQAAVLEEADAERGRLDSAWDGLQQIVPGAR